MTFDLERELWEWIKTGLPARDKIAVMVKERRLNRSEQAHRTLEKWSKKGLYDYGVALDLGWLAEGAIFPGDAGLSWRSGKS